MTDYKEQLMEKITIYTNSDKCEPRDRIFLPLLFGIFDALEHQNELFSEIWEGINKVATEAIKQFTNTKGVSDYD